MSNGDREYPGKVLDYENPGEAKRKYDVFCRLDWMRNKDGYRDAQEECRQWLKDWLMDRCGFTIDQLHDGQTVKWCELPNPNVDGNYATTALGIKEREAWWNLDDLGDQMQDYKSANRDWLEGKRKQLYHDGEGDSEADPDHKPWGWDKKDRRERYEQLQVATKHGSGWEDWKATHNTTTGEKKQTDSWRDKSMDWHNDHVGITEDPPNSNCDSRSDGIRTSQDKCAGGGTWLRYQPWCGVWAFRGLLAADLVEADGNFSWMASVASIEDYARAGKRPFRGWTTDGSKAKKGDLVVLFGRGQHVGTVRDIDSNYAYTFEGNTSSGSGGSQSNGGGAYKRARSRNGETFGYALIDG